MTGPEELLDEYNRLLTWWEAEGRPVSLRSPTKANLEVMGKFLDWCTSKNVDPMEFMQARICFVQDTRGHMPGFKQLASPALLKPKDDSDEDWKKWHHYRERWLQYEDDVRVVKAHAQQQREEQEHLLVYGLSNVGEKLKAGFSAAQKNLCALEVEHTFGYHPRSHHCVTCPVVAQADCKRRTTRRYGIEVVLKRERVKAGEIERF